MHQVTAMKTDATGLCIQGPVNVQHAIVVSRCGALSDCAHLPEMEVQIKVVEM